jgi:BirA family biotin operon repressor/biotin-[acetyl-CoA-carboxylase] ligase
MLARDFDSLPPRLADLKTRNRVVMSSIDSTNTVGKRIATFYHRNREPLPQTAVIAIEQTAGKGRLGNRWSSPEGGIYASLILPDLDHERVALLPMRVATALCCHLDEILDRPCRVKWPNDLMVDGKKIGGILIETVGNHQRAAAVIGFGINYAESPVEFAGGATCVLAKSGQAPEKSVMTARLIQALEEISSRPSQAAEVVEEYSHWSQHEMDDVMLCRTASGSQSGKFLGFDNRGFLRLMTSGGEELISAGEVLEDTKVGHHES